MYGDYVTLKLLEMCKKAENVCICVLKSSKMLQLPYINIVAELNNSRLLQNCVNTLKNNFHVIIMTSNCVAVKKQ